MAILEYCCQNWLCNPFQFKTIGLSDSYHSLVSPTSVKQNHWTWTPSGKACMSIQSLVLRRCTSASSSGLPIKSGLKCDQFNWGIGACWIGCVGGAGSYTEGAGGTAGGIAAGGWGAGGLPCAMSNYIVDHKLWTSS